MHLLFIAALSVVATAAAPQGYAAAPVTQTLSPGAVATHKPFRNVTASDQLESASITISRFYNIYDCNSDEPSIPLTVTAPGCYPLDADSAYGPGTFPHSIEFNSAGFNVIVDYVQAAGQNECTDSNPDNQYQDPPGFYCLIAQTKTLGSITFY